MANVNDLYANFSPIDKNACMRDLDIRVREAVFYPATISRDSYDYLWLDFSPPSGHFLVTARHTAKDYTDVRNQIRPAQGIVLIDSEDVIVAKQAGDWLAEHVFEPHYGLRMSDRVFEIAVKTGKMVRPRTDIDEDEEDWGIIAQTIGMGGYLC